MSKKLILTGTMLAGILTPLLLHAAPSSLVIYCGNLPGCGTSTMGIFGRILTVLLARINIYGYIFGGLMIAVGGYMVLTSIGNDERMNKGKSTIIWALVGVFLTNTAQLIVQAVFLETQSIGGSSDIFISIAQTIMGSIFQLLYISLFGIALFSGMQMVLSRGKDEEMTKARNALAYAAVGALIVNLASYLINALVAL